MKTNLKFLLPLLFLITAVIPVFAAFPGSGTREQSREIDLIRENSELSSENGELVRVDPDSYEPDDDAADYTLIDPTPFLGAQNHTLHSGTDLDWYRFYGYTDRNYHFYSTGTIDTDIYLYLDDGTTLLDYTMMAGRHKLRSVLHPTRQCLLQDQGGRLQRCGSLCVLLSPRSGSGSGSE